MEYKITKISEKAHSISEDESSVIKRAIPFYNNMLERYEKALLKVKEENDRLKEKPKTLDDINPFNVKDEITDYEIPTIDEIKTLVYSMWAKIVADVQTPYGCSGQKKKGIMKHSFREVQKGKFINKNVREIMNAFISKMTTAMEIQ